MHTWQKFNKIMCTGLFCFHILPLNLADGNTFSRFESQLWHLLAV